MILNFCLFIFNKLWIEHVELNSDKLLLHRNLESESDFNIKLKTVFIYSCKLLINSLDLSSQTTFSHFPSFFTLVPTIITSQKSR